MEFKLGDKATYNRVTKKILMANTYVTTQNFKTDEPDGETMLVQRRETKVLDKARTGIIVGRRRVIWSSYLIYVTPSDPDADDFIDIKKQNYIMVYLVAYTMGKIDRVFEESLYPEGVVFYEEERV